MDEGTNLNSLPRLSAEALRLINRYAGMGNELPVDLRPYLTRQREIGPAVIEAGLRWKVQPETVVRSPMFHVEPNLSERLV